MPTDDERPGSPMTPRGDEQQGPVTCGLSDYALLSDCQGAALVGRDGSIDWACLPRFDAPAVFARLLDAGAGHWRIAPTELVSVDRAYLPETMVLRTVFRTRTGAVAVTDAMALGPGERGHRIGHGSQHVIVRRVEGIEGDVGMVLDLALRPEYGLTIPVLMPEADGLRSRGGPRSYSLVSPVATEILDDHARASFRVRAGERVDFALAVGSPWPEGIPAADLARPGELLDSTIEGWHSWSRLHQSYDGPYAELVLHSGRVLQAMTYAPTGAVVAAPTTSLPESIGGTRNWDYRFCWVRDASLTLEALWVAACPDEAGGFFRFLATAAGGCLRPGSALQILYGVGGERLVPEHELEHLSGYRDSSPVRVGNGAWDQSQLDVYGELLNAAWLLAEQIGTFDEFTARFLVDAAETAAQRWNEPDQGIWEIRGEPRHFVHSKLMCWVALDRAIRLAPQLPIEAPVERWREVRDEIRAAIEDRGWSTSARSFVQAFESDELDASVLMLFIAGFLPPSDPRMRATIDAVVDGLSDEAGFLYRYRSDDGLGGEEGTFAICTFWLVQCLADLGDVEAARALFERLTACANDVGLLAEELDPTTGELLGNFPQAFTHIGLVNAAWAIARAEGRAAKPTEPPVDRLVP